MISLMVKEELLPFWASNPKDVKSKKTTEGINFPILDRGF
jgi:hypothetical protein